MMSTTNPLTHPRFIVDEKGRKTDAIISYKEFRKIQELLEDYYDIQIAKSRLNEEGISLEDFEKELKEDGIL